VNRDAAVRGLQWVAWGVACFLLVATFATQTRGLGGVVWPAAGVAVAAALHAGTRIWPVIALGAFAGDLAAGGSLGTAGTSSLVLAVETAAAGQLFGRALDFRPSLERLRDSLVLFFGTLGVAALGALAGVLAGPAPTDAVTAWLAWWTRDALGVLFMTPLATTWLEKPRRPVETGDVIGVGLLLAAVVAMGFVLFSGVVGDTASQYLMWFALFPLAVSAATQFGPREISVLNFALAATMLWVSQPASFVLGSALPRAALVDGFLGAVALATLALASITSEHRRTREGLRESEERFRRLTALSADWYWEQDVQFRFTYVSEGVFEKTGLSVEEQLGKTRWELPSLRIDGDWGRHRAELETHQSFFDLEIRHDDASGVTRWMSVSGEPKLDSLGRFVGYRGVGLDITERKRAERRIEDLATRDPLTGLPNRILFRERLAHALVSAQRDRELVALLFVDLDRFKTINDSLGHAIGDQFLKEVALRFSAATRKGDTLARLGGDEFVALLEGLRHPDDAGLVAQKLIASLSAPVDVGGHTLTGSCSVGISIYPGDAEDATTLLRNSDMAMYSAKESGRHSYRYYSHDMNVRAMERLSIESRMRVAIDNEEFELHFQPQVSLRDGRIIGAEALLRWKYAEEKSIETQRFVAVAEETGLIQPLGEWVLRTACHQGRAWSGAGAPRIAVNCSVRQFSHLLIDSVEEAIRSSGLDPQRLEIEITESLLMSNVQQNIRILQRLSDLGVKVAIDDFGTGYSSLGYLRRLKIDTIKIDRTFVQDIATRQDDVAIVGAIIALAHSLRMNVVAEGVETEAQREVLRSLDCDEGQGHLFSPAVSATEFAQALARGRMRAHAI